jgi:hypothetical protein
MSWLVFLLACRPPQHPVAAPHEIRYRPADPTSPYAKELVGKVAFAQWDLGLEQSTKELLSLMTTRAARISSEAAQLSTARAGFPGQARFAKILNGGAFPSELAQAISEDSRGRGVDVALSVRRYGDGIALWVAGWAIHHLEMDPIARDIPLDGGLALRVNAPENTALSLFLTPPEGTVQVLQIVPETHRWLRSFHLPGAYRMEVVTNSGEDSQVALLFSVFVDGPPPEAGTLAPASGEIPNPLHAEEWLYSELGRLRQARGLPPLQRFPLFEPLAREHSAWMASSGIIDHSLPNITPGVSFHAGNLAHPRARHFENVAAAPSAEEALHIAVDSPGHLQAFLCSTCTHVSIGAALEPVLNGSPRLFVTWELLEFPEGKPIEIDHFNRE